MKHELIDKGTLLLTNFLTDLTALSGKYGLAVKDGTTLFVMHGEDYERVYSIDDESRITFS